MKYNEGDWVMVRHATDPDWLLCVIRNGHLQVLDSDEPEWIGKDWINAESIKVEEPFGIWNFSLYTLHKTKLYKVLYK